MCHARDVVVSYIASITFYYDCLHNHRARRELHNKAFLWQTAFYLTPHSTGQHDLCFVMHINAQKALYFLPSLSEGYFIGRLSAFYHK